MLLNYKPIFDKRGKTVGWLGKNVVYSLNGNPKAFIEDQAVCAYNGEYLGIFENGFFRDRNGDAVAFIEGAEGGPLTPITEIPPIPPIPAIPPISPIPPIPPIPPVSSLSWSNLSWDDYLTGK